jgi:DNA-binding NarL/FixJ family response regulator
VRGDRQLASRGDSPRHRERRESRKAEEPESLKLTVVREEERTRIARELHDEIGQVLTGIKFSLEDVKTRIAQALELIGTEVETAAYRIVQDALTNVARYDGARRVAGDHTMVGHRAYVMGAGGPDSDPHQLLSTREREVLQLAASGYSSPEIGKRLLISPGTVESHRANMMRKLGLRNRMGLVRYAIKRGIVPSE